MKLCSGGIENDHAKISYEETLSYDETLCPLCEALCELDDMKDSICQRDECIRYLTSALKDALESAYKDALGLALTSALDGVLRGK